MTNLLKQAREYHKYAAVVRLVHYHMADARAWLNQVIGGLTVLAAAAVSTGILTHAGKNPSSTLTLAGGILAFVAAVLAGLQSFYKFSEVAEQHRRAAANYGDVKMKLELFLVEYTDADPSAAADALSALPAIQTELSSLDLAGPGFPSRLYRRAERRRVDGASLWPFVWSKRPSAGKKAP